MIRGLIFDLDGTLLDTIEDIAVALNRALLDLGLDRHSMEECKAAIGSGIHDLAELLLPPELHDPASIEDFIARFREHYSRNWHDSTHLFDGIQPLLDKLLEKNLRLAILSNKSQRFTALMGEYWFNQNDRQIFDPVWGERSGIPIKPDPAAALVIAKLWDLQPDEIAFIGDSDVDMFTAVNAGMMPIGVAWGFRSVTELLGAGARHILQRPEDLLSLLETAK